MTLDFQGYLRLTDGPCEETNNPGQWIRILTRETRLTLNPTWRPAEPELAQMDEVLVVREATVSSRGVGSSGRMNSNGGVGWS